MIELHSIGQVLCQKVLLIECVDVIERPSYKNA